MKTLVAVTIACLLSLQLLGQQIVNIELTSLTTTNCQITLHPSDSETSTLSNVVFTLRWRSSRNIALGNPTANNLIAVGCGLQAGLISDPIVINIPRSGTGVVSIAKDQYVEQQSVNGKYFVSIGGLDVTGNEVATTKSLRVATEEPEVVTMVYNPVTNQFYILRENVYYNMVGQRVTLLNTAELVVVRKSELP
jgi:hypothetical protein